jgi:hypothetical protein
LNPVFNAEGYLRQPRGKFAEVNSVRLHYLVAGEGDPIVLLVEFLNC